jgi:hypothetical protein
MAQRSVYCKYAGTRFDKSQSMLRSVPQTAIRKRRNWNCVYRTDASGSSKSRDEAMVAIERGPVSRLEK